MTSYSDLKLIDELLCDLRTELDCDWQAVERHTSVTQAAMTRLRAAWNTGEMPVITMGLEKYFRETAEARAPEKPA